MSSKEHLLAAFIADFKKGKKSGDPMQYARACKALVDLYGSPKEVADKLGVGKETVRILARLVVLPKEVQDLISARKIPITVAFDIIPLSHDRQIEVGNAVSGVSFKEARSIIRRLSENPDRSAASIRAEVMDELDKKEVNIVMIAISKKVYEMLRAESVEIAQQVNAIVEEWLTKEYPLDTSSVAGDEDLVSLTIKLPRKTFHTLQKRGRKPADLVERIIISWLKQKRRIT